MEDTERGGNAIHGALIAIALSVPIWIALTVIIRWIF
jgi:hypothetical protein